MRRFLLHQTAYLLCVPLFFSSLLPVHTWKGDCPIRTNEDAAPLIWRVEDQALEAPNALTVTVQAAAFDDLAAVQCAFRFDTSRLQFDSLKILQALPLATGDFGLFDIENGEIRLVWASANQGYNLSQDTAVFRFHFQVTQTGGMLSEAFELDDLILNGLAYTSAFVESPVELEFFTLTNTSDQKTAGPQLKLYQNRPNPFHSGTTIGFFLPDAGVVRFRVLNPRGRELFQTGGTYQGGYHEVHLQYSDLQTNGILWYELVTPFGSRVRKMMKNDR
ncbi:MAG: hypothetical protein EP344_17045 [Bacteroidetes bacterium]|nr:MAG: hypothetical protein EP344_17045 [Bacteroidota bacterium]